jgi:hypothetical protein
MKNKEDIICPCYLKGLMHPTTLPGDEINIPCIKCPPLERKLEIERRRRFKNEKYI